MSYNVVIPIEDANLAVEIRANHPIALGVKVAGHSQMGFVFDGADVRAGQREGLNAAVSAVSDEQRRFFRAKIDPQTVRRIEFTVAVARASNFSEEFTGARETQNMMRAVAITDKKIAVRSKGDVGGNKIDRPGGVGFIFARVAVRPNWLSIERGLHDFAAVDVAMIEEFAFRFAAQAKTVGAAAKFLAKRADETSACVIRDDRLAPHGRLVDGVSDIDAALFILREAVSVAPNETVGRGEPVMHAFIGVKARADDRQTLAGLIRCLHIETRNGGRDGQLRTTREKRAARRRFHDMSSGTTFAGTTPVNFCSRP